MEGAKDGSAMPNDPGYPVPQPSPKHTSMPVPQEPYQPPPPVTNYQNPQQAPPPYGQNAPQQPNPAPHHQPQAYGGQQQQTTVIMAQPQALPAGNQPPSGLGYPQGLRSWGTGLFGCFEDIQSCLCGYFCPCILACMTAGKLNESCMVPVCVQGGVLAMRVKTRMLYGIHGDICNDCLIISCCGACALCQNYRELQNMGR